MKQLLFGFFLFCFFMSAQAGQPAILSGEAPISNKLYPPSKIMVMKTLDSMSVRYSVDKDGDLIYTMNKKGWTGYIIFSYTAEKKGLWNVQVRTQFATKTNDYEALLEYANHWNSTQKFPKIAMKNRNKMVLSLNYPVQFGFNPQEFQYNIFNMFNRIAEKVGTEINRRH